jgi:polysaccharide biosynthesis/export protein
MIRIPKSVFFSLLALVLMLPQFSSAQAVTPGLVKKAEAKLKKMTPDQIRAKIESAGFTMDQAQAKAAQYGIDLNSYLRQGGSLGSLMGTDTTQFGQGQSGATTIPQVVDTTESAAPPETVVVQPTKPPFDSTIIGPRGLHYFGYEIFHNIPSAFEPMAAGPVDPDYLIGPSDVLRINLWGQVEQRNDLEVDNEGRIFIPTVGPVLVTGQTLEQAQKSIRSQMSQSYKGLAGSNPSVWLDVTIARLRPKRIFIIGEVKAPGGYTVSTYSTLFNSLYSVGGPTVKGSLRDVRLVRNGKVIAHVDLYGYLTGSDKINDVRVQDNDFIFVPPRGKTVSLEGEVRRPAIYELLPGENLKKLIEFAGGALPTTYLERVQVEHVVPFKDRVQGENEREVKDVNFRNIVNDGKDFTLADGDAVTMFGITEAARNFVTIVGPVYRPGRFQLEKVPRLRDLIFAADSLRPEVYPNRVDVTRMHADSSLEVIHVNLSRAVSGEASDNIVLKALDTVKIYSKWEIAPHRIVSIRGHILHPGDYPYADSLTLFDLIFRAGGLQDSIYRAETFLPRADLMRLNPDGITKKTLTFNLGALLDTLPGSNQLLEADDEIVIHSIDVAIVRNDTVEVRGKVKQPGRLHLTSNMTLRDAIYLAGGYTEDASTLEAEIARVVPKGMGEDSLVYIRFAELPDFAVTLAQNRTRTEAERAAEFHLQRYDIVFVRPNPEFRMQELVTLDGELQHAGDYALKYPNERLSNLITRAGGIKKTAFLLGGQMTRDSERVNVDFEKALSNPGSSHDIIVHGGDIVSIPKAPNSIRVLGEVNNPGILSYIHGDDMWNYIDRAGGVTDSANYALVHFPNGNVEKHGLGVFAGDPTVDDGSMIIVTKLPPPPPSTEGIDIGTTVKDMFAILTSAITIIYLASHFTK